MLDLLNTVIHWVIHGVQQIFNIITSIPAYVTTIIMYINRIPTTIKVVLLTMFTATIVIKIKRLVIS